MRDPLQGCRENYVSLQKRNDDDDDVIDILFR
jgi:hypothetical protein